MADYFTTRAKVPNIPKGQFSTVMRPFTAAQAAQKRWGFKDFPPVHRGLSGELKPGRGMFWPIGYRQTPTAEEYPTYDIEREWATPELLKDFLIMVEGTRKPIAPEEVFKGLIGPTGGPLLAGVAKAGIKGSVDPSTLRVNVFHGGPKLTKKQADDLMSSSRKRRNWSQDRKSEYYKNLDDVNKVRLFRDENNPNKFANMDPFLTPLKYRFEGHKLNLAKNEAAQKYGIDSSDMRHVYNIDDVELAAIKIKRKNDVIDLANNTPLWSKKFSDDVVKSAEIDFGVKDAINRANMEAVPRILKKDGWTLLHGSKDRSGRKSSRYLASPDKDYELRLSDHYLPDTMERAHSRSQYGTRWDDEIVLGGTESPEHIIDNIKKLYLETKSN